MGMNAGLAIERARGRIYSPDATVSKFDHFRSLHGAAFRSAV